MFFVYILASGKNGTLYVGMTDDLVRRIAQHLDGSLAGFTLKYGIKTLVCWEQHPTREEAFFESGGSKSGTECGSSNSSSGPTPAGTISC